MPQKCELQPPFVIKFNATFSFYCTRRIYYIYTIYIYIYIHVYLHIDTYTEIENGRLLSVCTGRWLRVLKYSDEASNPPNRGYIAEQTESVYYDSDDVHHRRLGVHSQKEAHINIDNDI